METGIKSLDGIEEVSIDFVSKKLRIQIAYGKDMEEILEKITAIVNRIEADVVLVDEHESKHHGKGEHHDHEHHDHEHGHPIDKAELYKFISGALLFAVATIFKLSTALEFILYFTAYLLVGYEVLLISIKNIARGEVFDENFLMSIATIGAFAIGEYPEGVAVMLFYQIGEFFQDAAVNNSRKSIKALMDIRPDYANLKIGDEIQKVSPEEVHIGSIIIIKPGEKVPLDGKVIEGNSMVDTTALTGESVPREIQAGDGILSGFINKNGLLTVEVSKEFSESTVSKILDLVENASSKKAKVESFITKFARYYTPVVVFIALGLAFIPPLLINGATFADWIYRALIFLVISCPCALVVSIPLGFFGGIGGASHNGILIKGSNYLEALNNVDTVVFDKTGTLTKGVFKVTSIISNNGFGKEELLEYAAYAESYSTHPIASSILKAYGKEIVKNDIQNYDEISGHGIKVRIKDKEVLAGNTRLMDKEGIAYDNIDEIGSIVHIAIDKSYAGYIVISDELKNDANIAIEGLKKLGISKIVMLTGDLKAVGQKIGKELGLDEVYSELLPDQKVQKLEELEQQKKPKSKIIFVGDGINDAPVLARADIGIAMGGLGSDAAIEAADIVIMTDEPSKLISAIKIARRTRSIVWQNIVFAMVVKAIVLILGAGGLASMWEAVFADVGVAVIAILNATRVMNTKNL
jgi:Zn2+/Cd2+-exporting ATPase